MASYPTLFCRETVQLSLVGVFVSGDNGGWSGPPEGVKTRVTALGGR